MYTRILGDEDAASKFMVDLEVVNPNTNASLKCPGVKLYPVDMKRQDVIKEEDGVLLFENRLAKKFVSVNSIAKPTKYEIITRMTIKKK